MATAALRVRAGLIPAGIRSQAEAEERTEREKTRERGELFASRQGLGRLFGSAGGAALAALLAPVTGGGSLALSGLVGAGSFAGQAVATKTARRRQVDAGTFFREQGQARERSFRRQTALSQLAAQGGLDALSALSVSKSLSQIPGLPQNLGETGDLFRDIFSKRLAPGTIKSTSDTEFLTSLSSGLTGKAR